MSFVTQTNSNYYLKLSDLAYFTLSDFNVKIKDLKGYTKIDSNWTDKVSLSSTRQSVFATIREFDTKLSIHTDCIKDIKLPISSKLLIKKERIANAGQVIGDIRFYDSVLNETNYDVTLTPYGYGKWKEMITGDYIYTKALCKYSIQASLNADRPNTRMYLHKVDVPDVVDRGIVELTKDNQPLFVKFSKDEVRKFHIVPELNVSIKSYSGTDKSPIIIPYDTTIEGFYVTMKADGEFVEGKISWSARGY